VEFVDDPQEADLELLHVIGPEALSHVTQAKRFAVIQYCTNRSYDLWQSFWKDAEFVVSYYDLTGVIPEGTRFIRTPLGVDPKVFHPMADIRDIAVFTTGYVTGPSAEAIEEVARAAESLHLPVAHLGPVPVGLTAPLNSRYWKSHLHISDTELCDLYARSKWVSGLRFIEGFELPVLEGLACGARPIVFDRSDMRHWYDGHAVFVPEVHGQELITILTGLLRQPPPRVSADERQTIVERFSWSTVVRNFWERAL
jgi:glycosyltransferase involved in cell wall biosynthesis